MKKIIYVLIIIFILILGESFYLYTTSTNTSTHLDINLPINYTLDKYQVKEILQEKCSKDSDCIVPGRYAVQSNCPYVSLCLQNSCTVVCPSHK